MHSKDNLTNLSPTIVPYGDLLRLGQVLLQVRTTDPIIHADDDDATWPEDNSDAHCLHR
ncbi:MAG: hypothetical protein H6631_19415 [Anaerolineaceae bacterium]|nr:hypothetical protein [Anaerolineaceae bacterium]